VFLCNQCRAARRFEVLAKYLANLGMDLDLPVFIQLVQLFVQVLNRQLLPVLYLLSGVNQLNNGSIVSIEAVLHEFPVSVRVCRPPRVFFLPYRQTFVQYRCDVLVWLVLEPIASRSDHFEITSGKSVHLCVKCFQLLSNRLNFFIIGVNDYLFALLLEQFLELIS